MQTNAVHEALEVGVRRPVPSPVDELGPGEVGYLIAGIKDVGEARSGETVTHESRPAEKPLDGYSDPKPMVFCGLFPVDSTEYNLLRDSLAKLKLNDSSFVYEPENSAALGLGFRCGFLGLLHLEIIVQRLDREYNLNLITTTPGVVYKINKHDGAVMDLQNPANMPEPNFIKSINEPWINATIILPDEYLGSIMKLCEEKRGKQKSLSYSGNRAVLSYELPLNEVVFDFYDKIKSISSGYASFDYELNDYREGDLIKLSILVNEEMVDALSMIIHKDFAVRQGRLMCERLKDLIPRHQFQIPIQAAIGGKIIARETISGYRKDVISRIHGGGARDRKKKLLEKQKKGKARMRQFGSVDIPQEAFIEVLKINKNE